MKIRSLIRVRLTRFFPSDRYIKNRCSGADGVLIDFEKKEDKVDDYKLSSFHRLKNSKFSLPKLLVDPVTTNSNQWIPRLIEEKSVDGVAMRNFTDDVISLDNEIFTMIWDTREQRITHSIISYHRINDCDIMWNSSIRTAVQDSLEHDIQPLAARTLRFRDYET